MLFNSLSFAIFLPFVFILHWFVFNRSHRVQNVLLLIASYYFYSCWDWRFLFLLAFSTLLDYTSGLAIYRGGTNKVKKFWLCLSIGVNLGLLGFFKYYNFFIESFSDLIKTLGYDPSLSTLNLILPIGISFYTFHGLSYVFDIYNEKITPTRNLVQYSLFVSFFPLLIAGPIERATHLLPQIQNPRYFTYRGGTDGLRQILWGLFKKIVIADSCAEYVNEIFNHSATFSGSTLLFGAVLFAFQIYGDFSGYSDIALGIARLFGFELLKNFNFPYFSRDIAEFWRKWHISLSSWFKDYLYFPLGGSREGIIKTIRNTVIIFVVSGFWHGPKWTFIVWGGLHALFIIPLVLFMKNRSHLDVVAHGKLFPSLKEILQIAFTFFLTTFAWIFFRAESLHAALDYISGIFSPSLFSIPQEMNGITRICMWIGLFIIVEWAGRENNFALEKLGLKWPRIIRLCFYMVLLIVCITRFKISQEFIYFQF